MRATAQVFPVLLTGRLLQAVATGISTPLMYHLVMSLIPQRKLGTYMGIAAMIISLAPALGPTYGGTMAAFWSWRGVFIVAVPLLLLTVRMLQQKYNEEHGITPKTIEKGVRDLISISQDVAKTEDQMEKDPESMSKDELEKLIKKVKKEMKAAAAELNFEAAAGLRDQMIQLKKYLEEF